MRSDDALLTLTELARESGVSASTLRNWVARSDRPLRPAAGSHDLRRALFTWAQLRAFCTDHPELRATRRVLRRPEPPTGAGGAPADPVLDPEAVHAALRSLRAAAASTLAAAQSAVRQAEEAARAHRAQIDALAAALNAYDDVLTQLTAPRTPHD